MKKYMKDTLEYYDNNSEEYYKEWNTDFLENYSFEVPDVFLSYLKPNSYILDLGCGVGRDSLYFKKRNYKVKAIDGSVEMCKIASNVLNEEVKQVNFLDIDYVKEFDGVFACASLLHLDKEELITCLNKIIIALKDKGILYASFKYGEGTRIKENRFFNDMTEDKFRSICSNFNSIEIVKVWKTEQYKNHNAFINFIIKKK